MRSCLLTVAVMTALTPVMLAQVAAAPCYEPNLGTQLGQGDDFVFPSVALGFPFSYHGTTYTDIEISTNGFVWLGALGNFNPRCCSGTGAQFVTDPASIAILWTDLISDFADPSSSVYFNALPGRAVITWKNWNEFGMVGTQPNFTLQMQLTVNGEVTFWYSPGTTVTNSFHTMVAGITPGNSAVDPGSTALSASFPIVTNTEPTLYEEWVGGAFDLPQRTWEIIPTGNGGWIGLDRSGCAFIPGAFTAYGTGCPALNGNPNAEFYEFFTPGSTFDLNNRGIDLIPVGSGYHVTPTTSTWFNGFTAGTNIGDDNVIQVTLPFTFPNPVNPTNTIGLCSNGYLHLSNSFNAPFTSNVADFLAGDPRIFGCWTDWYQPGAGQVYSDQISPTRWAFTWSGVAEFFSSTPAGTWQMQVESSGRVSILWQNINIVSHDILVGFSRGNGVPDPGNTDISAAMPFTTATGQQPLLLSQQSSSPVIGTTYQLRVSQQPSTAIACFLILGFNQLNVPLAGLGMPGCTQYLSLDSTTFFPVTGGATLPTLNLPNAPSLAGYTVFSQAAEFAPGVNPFGVAASNGGRITLGLF